MIDIERRKKLAFHLRQLAVGLTTNADFEDAIAEEVTGGWLPEQFYRSKAAASYDPIIIPMLELCWGLYDDTRTHKLTGSSKLSPKALKVIARCILFLRSDQEYMWPNLHVKPRFSLTDILKAILTLDYNLKSIRAEREQWQQLGDFDVWPFFSHAEYYTQLKHQPYLNSA